MQYNCSEKDAYMPVKRNLTKEIARAEVPQVGLTGQSLHTRQLNMQIRRIANTNLTVLIQGDTGTGKELVARCVHAWSDRADKPFIAVDCGALTESLIESELFGHRKGAFTGAENRRMGYFQLVDGGTLFLDEISNLSLQAQVKLLRCVQERRIFPLGSEHEIPINVRLLVASNVPLEEEVKAGRFRSDLFHRLNEFKLYLLPLRERREDILLLAEQFCQEANAEWQRNTCKFSPAARDYLLTYEWPGNVRELRNAVRRAVLLSTDVIEKHHLCQPSTKTTQEVSVEPALLGTSGSKAGSLPEIVDQVTAELEKTLIERVLRETKGNKSKAARRLKIGYKTLHRKLKTYGIKSA
jgi:two-component system nitrogen regulation response regulator GlnG